MRICDMNESDIRIGLRIESLSQPRYGTIVEREDKGSETYWYVRWDGEIEAYGGFFWNDCECEVVEE